MTDMSPSMADNGGATSGGCRKTPVGGYGYPRAGRRQALRESRRTLANLSLGFLRAQANTNPIEWAGHGDQPQYVQYHWHGFQLLRPSKPPQNNGLGVLRDSALLP